MVDITQAGRRILAALATVLEATTESILNPSSPKGPLRFSVTALLRLAHIRLNANLGACRDHTSGDPARVRQAFTNSQFCPLVYSPSLDRVISQCIHALSIPIRIGIPYVACTQTLHWCTEHSISYLECLPSFLQDGCKKQQIWSVSAAWRPYAVMNRSYLL